MSSDFTGADSMQAEHVATRRTRTGPMDDLEVSAEGTPDGWVGGSEQDQAGGADDSGEMRDTRVVAEVRVGAFERGGDPGQRHAVDAQCSGKRRRRCLGLGRAANLDDDPVASRVAPPVFEGCGEARPVLARRAASGMNGEQRTAVDPVLCRELCEPRAVDDEVSADCFGSGVGIDVKPVRVHIEAAAEPAGGVFSAIHAAEGEDADPACGVARELRQAPKKVRVAMPRPREDATEAAEQRHRRWLGNAVAAEQVGDLAPLQGHAGRVGQIEEFEPVAAGGDRHGTDRAIAQGDESGQQAEEIAECTGEEHESFHRLAALLALH